MRRETSWVLGPKMNTFFKTYNLGALNKQKITNTNIEIWKKKPRNYAGTLVTIRPKVVLVQI